MVTLPGVRALKMNPNCLAAVTSAASSGEAACTEVLTTGLAPVEARCVCFSGPAQQGRMACTRALRRPWVRRMAWLAREDQAPSHVSMN